MPTSSSSPPDCPFDKIYPSQLEKDNLFYMKLAYNQAIEAWNQGEVPVGAIIVKNDEVIAAAGNQTETNSDPTAHAEMIAITQACRSIGDWRLTNARLFVTKEPCPMCAGAILSSRLDFVAFGAPDPAMGGLGGAIDVNALPRSNHRTEVVAGLLDEECLALIQGFFRAARVDKNSTKPACS
ncbi:MAG: nucleoside deaminase [Opitutales bacterium]